MEKNITQATEQNWMNNMQKLYLQIAIQFSKKIKHQIIIMQC